MAKTPKPPKPRSPTRHEIPKKGGLHLYKKHKKWGATYWHNGRQYVHLLEGPTLKLSKEQRDRFYAEILMNGGKYRESEKEKRSRRKMVEYHDMKYITVTTKPYHCRIWQGPHKHFATLKEAQTWRDQWMRENGLAHRITPPRKRASGKGKEFKFRQLVPQEDA